MAFTDATKALAFRKQQELGDTDGAPVFAVSVDKVPEYLLAFEDQGVAGVAFNEDTHGFFTPLKNLRPMHDYFIEKEQQG